MLSHSFLTAIDSHGTLHLAFGLVGMHSIVVSTLVVRKVLYSSFRICISDISRRVSNLFLTFTVYRFLILVSEDQSYREDLPVCFLLLCRLRHIFAVPLLVFHQWVPSWIGFLGVLITCTEQGFRSSEYRKQTFTGQVPQLQLPPSI